MSGTFSSSAGPQAPPLSQPRFGIPARPPSPQSPLPPFPRPIPALSPSPRGPEAVGRVRSPPLAHGSSGLASSPYQSAGFSRRPGAPERAQSPPGAFHSNHRGLSSSLPPSQRLVESPPGWINAEVSSFSDDNLTNPGPSAVTSFVASRNSGNRLTATISRFQDMKRTRSPPSHSPDEDISGNSSESLLNNPSDLLVDNGNYLFPPRARSPSSAANNNGSFGQVRPSFGEGHRPALSSSMRDNQPIFPRKFSNSWVRQDHSSILPPSTSSYDSSRAVDARVPKRTRSPPVPLNNDVLQENINFSENESKRPFVSPSTLSTRSNALLSTSNSQPESKFTPAYKSTAEPMPASTSDFSMAKRAMSPPLDYSNEFTEGISYSINDGTEREIQAKAKRLARFKEELREDFENISDRNKLESTSKGQIVRGNLAESARDATDTNLSSDFEGSETPTVIVGLCPDMCPESERAERERKGDLDQYERLDGDRNQTNKYLAVKKYNRTAEREANLIRPMPILQKTVDYLLNLLDQPYDDSFLGMYNFLWDRMRAIRMDLRMQHIFNLEAITMLEQMIRLHIIVMHEMCEYTKGEGFAEGFDAHLNIEQMNKTSVELFQMYDDHRKKGISMPTECEFRGYYALLKLDKHPGYKVEPAELSLDLAKMTLEIRRAPEVLFARDVARACRTGNFIAFFRLARKASYLQACLMHAHFAKLRTQALASLHSSLQNGQGLPLSHVAKWLAMEEENIEDLLEYHGFLIKEFEEPYMVKEGPFLNDDKDYPTKCSKLVHLKKSSTIVEDVSQPSQMALIPSERRREIKLSKDRIKCDTKTDSSDFVGKKSLIHEIDNEMLNSRSISSSKVGTPVQPVIGKSMVDSQTHSDVVLHISPWSFPSAYSSPGHQPAKFGVAESSPNLQTAKFGVLNSSPEHQLPKFGLMESTLQRQLPKFGISGSAQEHQLPEFGVVEDSPERQSPKLEVAKKTSCDAVFGASPEKKTFSDTEGASLEFVPTALQERSRSGKFKFTADSLVPVNVVVSASREKPGEINRESVDEVMDDFEDEVFQAKIKLIIRLWRRRSSRQKELREQRQVATNAALNLLSLGPPIRLAEERLSSGNEFDIDRITRERNEKLKQSWSRLNVSEVVVDILGRRNPHAKCLCWKVILCLPPNTTGGDRLAETNQLMHAVAGPWLKTKLMPSKIDSDKNGCDADLLISVPGISIWRKWMCDQSSASSACCFSVIKNVNFNNLIESVAGGSAVIFIASENMPWNNQRAQLHSLLTSLPPGSSLPLLILSDSYNRGVPDPASIIIQELGVLDIDKSRVSSFLVVSLVAKKETEHGDGFFSDKLLREGLQWLANESPLQPNIHCIRTRELVLSHLNTKLDVLEKMNHHEVGPNQCISALNEALDWSLREITAAAKANPSGWPCPEIALLEHLSDEQLSVQLYFPEIGWNSEARIEPLLSALSQCKLPKFLDDISWLVEGANTTSEIENMRSRLENCLFTYLMQSTGVMGSPLAMKEAHVMLQRSAHLELHDSTFYVVPKWIMVFRRIINWRLMSLSTGACSFAYVLRRRHLEPTSQTVDKFMDEGVAFASYLSQPSLDEMIDAACSFLGQKNLSQAIAFQSPARTVSTCDFPEDAIPVELTQSETDSVHNGNVLAGHNVDKIESLLKNRSTDAAIAGKANGEADKLSKLLEQCNIVQNSIDQKLSVYF